ncbi:cyclin-dependent protein kinase [Kappamyces sp. JEL0829]|nr:cyclin-dependent protein kinase [Kappamyces sp. JEL0829]
MPQSGQILQSQQSVVTNQGNHYDKFIEFKKRPPKTLEAYSTLGFISSGTYGNVFKAKKGDRTFAVKKFKTEKEGEAALASGISQSAVREIGLCRELKHENVVFLEEVVVDCRDRSIAMVFEYADHDLLQILHHHLQYERKPIPEYTVKSFLWQLLNGVAYLHANWVLHRDLKPANILVSSDGVVKIADLGLARLFQAPLNTLYHGDKVVVTIWYRSPELLLGSRHYTKAIDIWAVGCIFAELLMLKPLFKGEEAKMDKKSIPFQRDQLLKIVDVLGMPTSRSASLTKEEQWDGLKHMPDLGKLSDFPVSAPNQLKHICQTQMQGVKSESAYLALAAMLQYDPEKRISAIDCMQHKYFSEQPKPGVNSFIFPTTKKAYFNYPERKMQPPPESKHK